MIRIVVVGKKHETMYLDAINHFEKRLKPWQKIEWLIIPPSGKNHELARTEESTMITAKLGSDDFVVLLDEEGEPLSSPEIAKELEKAQNQSKNIVFVIGGAYGVDEHIKSRANLNISFGRAVFPHQLVRVMLLEQLYRAHSIMAGSGYHHV